MADDPTPDPPPASALAQQRAPGERYLVLARKYRPASFASLIGQEALVRTLTNAIRSGRIAQAYMLTGVRGVGKTTTARIIAKALNCIGPDGHGAATPEPCGQCEPCLAIAADRHVDVLEIDAASNTGVDDVRELIDSSRYAAASARFKVFIVDEVHMLSKSAFNALLKTLEEPPAHVIFIFATTEIRKVPVTVLSRCQKFDLRRVDGATLEAHYASICQREGVGIEGEALKLIARAADGSVRDGLSLLDQAIALGGDPVTTDQVRAMLGLVDRAPLFDLLDAALAGQTADALAVADRLHASGADALTVVQDLLSLVHLVSRMAATGSGPQDLPELEQTRGGSLARRLSVPALTKAWQLMLKGVEEVQRAPDPQQALEMLVIRLAFAATLPDPGELARMVQEGKVGTSPSAGALTANGPSDPGGSAPLLAARSVPVARLVHAASPGLASALAPPTEAVASSAPSPASSPAPATPVAPPETFREMVALFRERGEIWLHSLLLTQAYLVDYRPGFLSLRLDPAAPVSQLRDIRQRLAEWTGVHWDIVRVEEGGDDPLDIQDRSAIQAEREAVKAEPLVAALLLAFPGAIVQSVAPPEPEKDS